MAGRSEDESPDRVVLDGPPAEWIADRAAALDLDPQEYLEQVIASIRSVESEAGPASPADADALESVADRVDVLEDRLDEQIQDVRERVIQVKREADEKATVDHDHGDLREDVTELHAAVDAIGSKTDAVADRTEAMEQRLDRMSDRLDRGFENYEEILQYLLDTTDELDEHVDAIGSALLALRRRERDRRIAERRRERAAQLKETAQRHGATEATCAACESEISIGLLTEPACPFCGASLADVTPKRGFFGSATLETGSAPALQEGDDSDDEAPVEAIVERDGADTDRESPEILDEDGSLVDVESPSTESPDTDRKESNDE